MIDDSSVASETVTIEAPAELVWEVITDFPNYHLWNEFCPRIEGQLALGEAVTMQVDLGAGLQEQVEYITRIDPPQAIVWSMENRPGDPIHAARLQQVTPIDAQRCTYVTVDTFAGEEVGPMLEAMGKPVEDGFNRCARGLKARAEALYRERQGTG